MISFYIRIEPVAWQRARRCGKRYFTAPKSEKFKNDVRRLLLTSKDRFGEYYNAALALDVTFAFDKPKSVKRKFMTARPDLDNFLKGLLDAFNEIVYKDDAQVVEFAARKLYAEDAKVEPGIHVKITKMGE